MYTSVHPDKFQKNTQNKMLNQNNLNLKQLVLFYYLNSIYYSSTNFETFVSNKKNNFVMIIRIFKLNKYLILCMI